MKGFRCLEEGQTVQFDVVDGEKGKMAVNVLPISMVLEVNKNEAYEITLL